MLCLLIALSGAASGRLDPDGLAYIGAFRVPEDPGFEYSGGGLAYRPDGDPDGPSDGFPGSLFIIGHDQTQLVAEISIPAPVDHRGRPPGDLPRARFLQPFSEVTGGVFGSLELPRADLEYLEDGGGQLWICMTQHMQFEVVPVLCLCGPDLRNPGTMGPWLLGDLSPYLTGDLLFEIPAAWSGEHLPGARLVCGRFRDGTWSGRGPALNAVMPPEGDLPPPGGLFETFALTRYGWFEGGGCESITYDYLGMDGFGESDDWSGGAWVTAPGGDAVVLAGTRSIGESWYGYSNGVVYPTSGEPGDPIPETPPWPHDDRGWWAGSFTAGLLFFDPEDFRRVLAGELDEWEVQPYAFAGIDSLLVDPRIDLERARRHLTGACAFDRENGILYVVERRADGEMPVIHAFGTGEGAGS